MLNTPRIFYTRLYPAAIALAALFASARVGYAQSPNDNAAVKITLVATDDPPAPGERIIVIRRGTGVPENIIVLPETDAKVEDLAVAFGSLVSARARDGDVLRNPEERTGIRGGSVAGTLGENQQRFSSMLDRLAKAKPRFVRGIGNVRAIDVSLHLSRVAPPA